MNNTGEEPPLGHPPGPRKPPAGIKYRKYPGVTHKYCSEIHSYQSWVDTEQRKTRDGLYLTRRNVDDYFQKIVVWERYNVNNDTASGIASALQVFANNHEFRYDRDSMPSPKPKIFKVRDTAKGADCPVAQALWQRQVNHVRYEIENTTSDPHHNLPTSTVSFEKQKEVSQTLLEKNSDLHRSWLQFLLTWNVAYATYMRMEALKQVRICDLCVSPRAFARQGPNSNCLGLIIQKFIGKGRDTVSNPIQRARTKQQKTGNTAAETSARSNEPIKKSGKRICFMWRHKDVECCGTASIAMQLFSKLHDPPQGFHFQQEGDNPHERPWFNFMLLDSWATQNRGKKEDSRKTVDYAYRKVLKEHCGLDANHLTHLRSSAIEQASTYGLDCMRISTQSKHMMDKINRFYMAESTPEVMKMMSGFRHAEDGEYFVPRSHLEIPFQHQNEFVKHIFPAYPDWIDQYRSCKQKSKASLNFLFEVIPFLARTLIQDAPFLMKKFPNCAFSCRYEMFVLSQHPEYRKFNTDALQKVKDLDTQRLAEVTKNCDNGYRYVKSVGNADPFTVHGAHFWPWRETIFLTTLPNFSNAAALPWPTSSNNKLP